MASRSSVPPRFRSPRPRHVDVDVDPTSIDVDDYCVGLDADGVDLGRVDLFGASDGGDGGNGMATPSSNTSMATTGAPVATAGAGVEANDGDDPQDPRAYFQRVEQLRGALRCG
jgi:hypothetical protein